MLVLPVQIDNKIKKNDSLWVVQCSECQCERILKYKAMWYAKTYKTKCSKCIKRNTSGLVYGRKYNGGGSKKTLKIKTRSEYVVLFKGICTTEESRKKQRESKLGKYGKESNAWKGGSTNKRILEMSREKYKNLRKDVYKRDNYSCVLCNYKGNKLQMDHIKPWCNYVDLRYDMNNCRTLCEDCHKKTDTYGAKALRIQ